MNQKLFGNRITPACRVCAHGCLLQNGEQVLCEHRGLAASDDFCRRFLYDPLSRVPKPPVRIAQYPEGEFSLETDIENEN